jgi:hypothetical protein
VPPGAEADQADHSWEPNGIPSKFRETNRNIEVGPDPQHERTMWVETIIEHVSLARTALH